MYGKHFESMYEGSMYGAGVAVFAVWGYVISHTRNSSVELNPKKLADTLGGTVDEIREAVEFLMKPDADSRHKEHEGRRLIKDGEFQYRVPSWEHYYRMQNESDRREYNREMKRRERSRKRTNGRALPGEALAVRMSEAGHEDVSEWIAAERMPSKKNGEPNSDPRGTDSQC